jgi:hypothetical protein
MLPSLLVLLACGSDDSSTPAPDGPLPCVDPNPVILAPVEGDVLRVGEQVTLSGEASGRGPFIYLWAADRDTVARGADAAWTPSQAGTVELILQAEDDCGVGQARLELTVTAVDDTAAE